MNGEFKYEVAFSFLQDDEQLALEIANRVRDRVSVGVFLYSERQDELVGTDGVETFSRIFGEESRIVVILFREGWGQTPWTRTEENAIRARGFKQGHEFVLLVKLDAANPPVWLPPTRIYLGFDRYRIDGVASVIEARVQATGGTVHGESVADYAARISRDLDFERERRAFLASDRGVESAKREVEVLFGELNRLVEQVNQTGSRIQVGLSGAVSIFAVYLQSTPGSALHGDCVGQIILKMLDLLLSYLKVVNFITDTPSKSHITKRDSYTMSIWIELALLVGGNLKVKGDSLPLANWPSFG